MARALVIGETTFPFHDFDGLGPHLRSLVTDAGVEATATTDRETLTDLADYDVVVDYVTDSSFTDAQREGLLSFVRGGGGYAGVHCAADLTTTADGARDDPFPDLREMLGGHFVGHPEQCDLPVNVVDAAHPVTADVDDFTVWDEPYDLDVDDDVRVLARMDHPDLGDLPVAWTTAYGDGRVFYCSLGHGEESLTDDGTRTLVGRGVRWAARDL